MSLAQEMLNKLGFSQISSYKFIKDNTITIIFDSQSLSLACYADLDDIKLVSNPKLCKDIEEVEKSIKQFISMVYECQRIMKS